MNKLKHYLNHLFIRSAATISRTPKYAAKQWNIVIDCFEDAQQFSDLVFGMDEITRYAAVAFGKIGRSDRMMELYFSDPKMIQITSLVVALHPIVSGRSMNTLHSRVISFLTTHKSDFNKVIDSLFDSAISLLSNSNSSGEKFIQAMNVLLLRTKLHSLYGLFYEYPLDFVRQGLEFGQFQQTVSESTYYDNACSICSGSFLKSFYLAETEVKSLREMFWKFLDQKAQKTNVQSLLEEQIYVLHQTIRSMGGSLDVVIDGLNAAHNNAITSMKFELSQVVLTKVHQLVHRLKLNKVLILVPDSVVISKRLYRFDAMEREIKRLYGSSVVLHRVNKEFLDDCFVIYAALVSNSFVLSNDLYRDHVGMAMALYPQAASLLPSFIMSRRIKTSGTVSARNLTDRNSISVYKPPSFSYVPQFSIKKLNAPGVSWDLILHEPVDLNKNQDNLKLRSRKPIQWICAKRNFTGFCEKDNDLIDEWVEENL
ncbi:uncharacterized protein LOC134839671 isoform X3 [Symsagittifera roscoffensis]|uniref:uncharacterized protein LOC134839671 isoform X3 n=1 Tax=Symsagittifera roscoffensis TaxID=84072 RepID=UPI00307B1C5C